MPQPFARLNLPADMLKNLSDMGYAAMTPIQSAALPLILKGSDVIAQAATGSGKTAAFGIGLIQGVNVRKRAVQALVLCPTRELAEQVAGELRRLGRTVANLKILTLCGGIPMRPQRASLVHGAHIIVGTPGRIKAFLDEDGLDLTSSSQLVLDEADRMLDMGFWDDVEKIISHLPEPRQSLLFSATFREDILEIAERILENPERVTVDTVTHAPDIEESLIQTDANKKVQMLEKVLESLPRDNTLIFCNRKTTCSELSRHLNDAGFHALDIHGDLDQKERTETLICFKNGSFPILVATDLAARGLDIQGLPLVINYDVPERPEVYRHRIGRTGRAGESGIAITLATPEDTDALRNLEAHDGRLPAPMNPATLPKPDAAKRPPALITLFIEGGKRHKLRPGDILGALTKDVGLPGNSVGKIDVLDRVTYVAVRQEAADDALEGLRVKGIKGRSFRIWSV